MIKKYLNSKALGLISLIFSLCVVSSLHAAVPTGAKAPEFTIPSIIGEDVNLADYQGKIVVLEWYNQNCPYVKKHYSKGDMQKLQRELSEKGIIWLTIASTNPSHKDYLSPEALKELSGRLNMNATQFLVDQDGAVGKKYSAKTTPHMYVISADGKLVYQGAIDDNNGLFNNPAEAKNYVREAVTELLAGNKPAISETDPYGCSVKYAE